MKRIACLLLAACVAIPAFGCGKRGNAFTDMLPSNPTTGYDWVYAEDGAPDSASGKVNVELEYFPGEAPEGYVGAGGGTRVTVTGVEAGDEAIVRLYYVRPWEWENGYPAANQVTESEGVAVYRFRVHKDLSVTFLGSSVILPEGMQ